MYGNQNLIRNSDRQKQFTQFCMQWVFMLKCRGKLPMQLLRERFQVLLVFMWSMEVYYQPEFARQNSTGRLEMLIILCVHLGESPERIYKQMTNLFAEFYYLRARKDSYKGRVPGKWWLGRCWYWDLLQLFTYCITWLHTYDERIDVWRASRFWWPSCAFVMASFSF